MRQTGLIRAALRYCCNIAVIVNLVKIFQAAKSFGANMEEKGVGEVTVDTENKIVTTPAYMFNGKFHEIQDGVTAMINELMKLL